MASIAGLIDFLMSMMRDEKTKMAFERDPDTALADRGLSGVTGQDVRDARLMMADDGVARARSGSRPDRGGPDDDPVREIRHVTNNYELDQSQHLTIGELNQTILAIDDRDATVVDSFNNDNDTDVVAIQDNDTIDNSTTNDVDVVNVEDSFNDAPPEPDPESDPEVEPAPEPEGEPEPEVSVEPVEPGPEDVPFADVEPEPADLPDDLEPAVG